MFLSQVDYLPLIQPEIKQAIASDPSIWSTAELQAEEEITSYLRARFDVPAIFNQIGTARSSRLVMIMVDIALYHVHSRIAPRNIPEIREIRYEQAIDWLKAINKGTIMPQLPMLQDTTIGGDLSAFKLGSNAKLNHTY